LLLNIGRKSLEEVSYVWFFKYAIFCMLAGLLAGWSFDKKTRFINRRNLADLLEIDKEVTFTLKS
jgi:hypothetical protein